LQSNFGGNNAAIEHTLYLHLSQDENHVEENPHECVQHSVIGHILYGSTDAQLPDYLNDKPRYEKLKQKKNDYWVSLIKTHFLESFYVCVEATPSAALGQEMMKEEEKRVNTQVILNIFSLALTASDRENN
jgi:Zn-dependent M16 (insulinase) family peptidase